jgi:hypothetical protein
MRATQSIRQKTSYNLPQGSSLALWRHEQPANLLLLVTKTRGQLRNSRPATTFPGPVTVCMGRERFTLTLSLAAVIHWFVLAFVFWISPISCPLLVQLLVSRLFKRTRPSGLLRLKSMFPFSQKQTIHWDETNCSQCNLYRGDTNESVVKSSKIFH